jgi:hypothetical protein
MSLFLSAVPRGPALTDRGGGTRGEPSFK